MKQLFSLAVALSVSAVAEEFSPHRYAEFGMLITTQFVTAPFPHESRASGHTYKDQFYPADQHYHDNTVALFVPQRFQPNTAVDFVVHFHGWRNTVAGTLMQYQLIEQLVASGKNAILIVPEGPQDAPDSAGGKLEDAGGFQRFMAEALAALQQRGVVASNAAIGQVILSGHSGGYQVMSSIVDRGGLTNLVREVWLFDGLYARGEKFLAWADQAHGRLVNIYTDGGGTKARTEEMLTVVKQQERPFLATTDVKVTGPELSTNRFVFLHTDLKHNEVLAKRKTFQLFLATSCLNSVEK